MTPVLECAKTHFHSLDRVLVISTNSSRTQVDHLNLALESGNYLESCCEEDEVDQNHHSAAIHEVKAPLDTAVR